MATFELDSAPDRAGKNLPAHKASELGIELSVNNIRWLTTVRWAIVSGFFVVGLAGWGFPALFIGLGFEQPSRWPWLLGLSLAAANGVFSFRLHRLSETPANNELEADLWLQIVVDLAAVTVLVHFVGSSNTPIPFVYLLHVILACIFFPAKKSLFVTTLAASLYCACVAAEFVWGSPLYGTMWPRCPTHSSDLNLAFAVSTVLIWFAVWYLTSTLSEAARLRQRQLNAANEQLRIADQEKTREVLQAAHDLKAPFSGILSSIDVMKFKHWAETPEPVRAIIERIDQRTQALSFRIRDMLLLGGLKLRRKEDSSWLLVDLLDVANEVLQELQNRIKEKEITVSLCVVEPVKVWTKRRAFFILASNIVANAVFYSHDRGGIEVTITEDEEEALFVVSDQGIGIKEESLPYIFDEYYRTQEAARFNRLSTGLGLAIVKQAAIELGLKLQVDSEFSKGTTFTVRIPKRRKEDEPNHG